MVSSPCPALVIADITDRELLSMDWWRLAAGLAALYGALILHETGHLVAARLNRFRFGLIGVGPLCLVRTTDGIQFRWLPPRYWGPFAVAHPTDADRITARMAWYAAGGPLASLLVSGMAALGLLLPGPGPRPLFWLALTSGCLFVATAQPWGTGSGLPSDGGRVWALLRGEPAAVAAAALVALDGQAQAGVRPRDWAPGLVNLLGAMTQPPADVLAARTALLRMAIDRGDVDEAGRLVGEMRRTYPLVPPWLRGEAAAEMTFWFGHFEKRGGTAAQFLDDATGVLVASHLQLRAEAAVRVCRFDHEGGRDRIAKARAAAASGPSGATAFDHDMLDALERRLDTAEPNHG